MTGINGEKTVVNYVLISKILEDRLKNVNVLRGVTGGISDHLVEAKLKVKSSYSGGRREGDGIKREI